jgi:ankyrin repeat protein
LGVDRRSHPTYNQDRREIPDQIINKSGMTELHLAAYHGELDWVRNCLNGGLDVNAQDNGGYTPLHWVADMGLANGEREEITDLLIASGGDVQARLKDGTTVLMKACSAGNGDIVRRLVMAGADVNA